MITKSAKYINVIHIITISLNVNDLSFSFFFSKCMLDEKKILNLPLQTEKHHLV